MNKLIEAPISQIVITKDNPRTADSIKDNLSDLQGSIAKFGVRVPIMLRPHPKEKGKFELRAGHRRVAASKPERTNRGPSALLCG